MAKQVIWSLVAKKQLKEAFQILKLKNGNNEVGEVLYVQLQNILHRISMNPFIIQQAETTAATQGVKFTNGKNIGDMYAVLPFLYTSVMNNCP